MPNNKPISWSHSALESFETCPQKHYRTRVAKDVHVDWDKPAILWGRDVHAALDRRLRLGAELPSNMSQYEKHAAKLEELAEDAGFKVLSELQLACTQQLKPCDWKDWDNCWARAAIDVALISPTHPLAMVWDWKTGKRKTGEGADQQLAICALLTFIHYPHVEKVSSGFFWLKENERDRVTFKRENMKLILKQVLPKVRALTDAHYHGQWPTRPSGLCAQYCEVTDCKFNGAYQGDK